MQFVDVARVELLKNRDKPIGGDIIPDYERGQSNKSDTADGKRPQRVAIADLNIARRRYRSLHRDKPIGGDIIPDYERGQSNKSDTADGKRPQRVAIADLNIARRRYRSLHAFVNQRPALCHSGVAEAKTIMLRQVVWRFRNAVSCEIAW